MFFHTSNRLGANGITHVGMYIGNNKFVHASSPSSGIKISSLTENYYKSTYVCARRVA